ncbi:MAG TPA: ABC transporter permease [Candidatus Acidoferrum sp.]|nr:ABC transporter permease [Candidatus Acidoferrum sp.]
MTFSFWRRQKREHELDEELQSHLEMAASDRMERGEKREMARSAALREMGNVSLIKEVTRDKWGWRWIGELMQDLRYGLRMMRRSPGFVAVAVVTLALGIGANTAIFSLIDGFMLNLLPVKNPEQLVFVRATRSNGSTFGDFPYAVFERLRDGNGSLAGVFAWDDTHVNVILDGQAEIVDGDFVSGSYFEVLSVEPFLGRLLTSDDDHAGKKPVAVISHAYWKRRFAESPEVIGKTIYVAQVPFTIVGVTSPRFFGRNVAGKSADIVLPMWLQPELGLKDHDTFDIMGRLKPEVSLEQARADLDVVYQRALRETARQGAGSEPQEQAASHRIVLKPGLRGERPPTDNFATEVRILAAVTGIALLIVCVNIAGLFLARASGRQKEIAVRLAIGAGRGRLIRQLLTESALIAVIGGGLGLLLAKWGAGIVLAVLSGDVVPFDLNLNVRVLMFTGAVSLLTGIAFGLAPAMTGTRFELTPSLKGTEGWGESGVRHGQLTKLLVVAQAGLSLALLTGAGLLLKSLKQLYAVDTGFDRERVLTMWVFPALDGYDHAREISLYRELSERLNATAGVESASLSRLMMIYGRWDRNVWVKGEAEPSRATGNVYCDPVGPRFFQTMGIHLLLGREFAAGDTETSQKVAIISESMAQRFFAGESPLGRRLGFDGEKSSGDVEIVGVVKDIRHHVEQDETREAAWIPYTQAPADMYGQMTLLVRPAASENVNPDIRDAVQSWDKTLPISEIRTEGAELNQYLGAWRSMSTLLGFFSGLALLLAALGLYGAMSYLVGRRTKELGIRLSLGAQKGNMLWMVLSEALLLVAAGFAIGVPTAMVASRLLSSLLFGVTAGDPETIAGAIVIMAVVALLAAYLPARRAMRVDPIVALRYE